MDAALATVTVRGEGDNAVAELVMEQTLGGPPLRVVSATLRALDGHSLGIDDFKLFVAMAGLAGVPVPLAELPPPPPPPPPAPKRRVGKAKGAPAKQAVRRAPVAVPEEPRAHGQAPSDEDLLRVWRAQAGKTKWVAEHFGVSRHTVYGWTRRARERGVVFTLDEVS